MDAHAVVSRVDKGSWLVWFINTKMLFYVAGSAALYKMPLHVEMHMQTVLWRAAAQRMSELNHHAVC